MTGDSNGPETSDGDLTGDVAFTMGQGCGEFDYGYEPEVAGRTPRRRPTPERPRSRPRSVRPSTFAGTRLDRRRDPNGLDYSWDFGDGGSTKDAAGGS